MFSAKLKSVTNLIKFGNINSENHIKNYLHQTLSFQFVFITSVCAQYNVSRRSEDAVNDTETC